MGAYNLQPPGAKRDATATVTASLRFWLSKPRPLLLCHMVSCLCSQAVDITSCGNFTVIGSSCGHVDVYNLQSGLHRGCYGDHEKGEFTCFCCF